MATMPKLLKVGNPDTLTPPKSKWETIVTLTPVMLTLLATVLAGLSSSEMIQAQYYRSLAAQNQSKAGDQWGFFQAKRIRGTIVERLLDQKPGIPGRVEPEQLRHVVERLADRYQSAKEQASSLQAVAAAGQPLHDAAGKLLGAATANAADAMKDLTTLTTMLAQKETQAALAYLGTDRLPQTEANAPQAPGIAAALEAVANRQPEEELAPLLLEVDAKNLQTALETAETNAKSFEDAAKGVDRSLRDADALVRRERAMAYGFHRAAGEVETALADQRGQRELQAAAAAVASTDTAIQRTADQLNDYRDARDDFTARRNEREARNNQAIAGLYELQVHQNSVISEKHRRRSKNFFYGMLCAQGGVAIASLSLAARRRSALWGMAGVAGLTALIFSIYIYLYV